MIVKISYKASINTVLYCNLDISLKDICLKFCADNNIDFNSIGFIFGGRSWIISSENKKLRDLQKDFPDNNLVIIIVDKTPENPQKTIIFIIFHFDSNSYKIQFSIKEKMSNIFNYFSYKINKNIKIWNLNTTITL